MSYSAASSLMREGNRSRTHRDSEKKKPEARPTHEPGFRVAARNDGH